MSSDTSRHPFFNAMVLMGGSIALGCGGSVVDRRGAHDRADSGDPGAANGSGGIGETGSGGSGGFQVPPIIIVGTGGSQGSGGYTAYPPLGGGGSSTAMGDPSLCPPSQWNCSGSGVYCNGNEHGWNVPPDCRCDDRRPKSDASCAKNQAFVCRKGTVLSDAGVPAGDIYFECYCVDNATDCSVCDAAYNQYYDAACGIQTYADGRMDIRCGCAVIYLR